MIDELGERVSHGLILQNIVESSSTQLDSCNLAVWGSQ
jgi:hypothetical protein